MDLRNIGILHHYAVS